MPTDADLLTLQLKIVERIVLERVGLGRATDPATELDLADAALQGLRAGIELGLGIVEIALKD